MTPGALAGGTLALIVLAYFLLRQPLAVGFARFAIGLAAVPVLPLLPPGIVFFYLYRRSWRRGRLLRAHRDVLMAPLRYFAGDEPCVSLPTGELYCREEWRLDALTQAFADGMAFIEPTIDAGPTRWTRRRRRSTSGKAGTGTVFGHPGSDWPVRPSDTLAEWIAVRGDPVVASAECQRQARRYELASAVILGGGLLVNFVLVLIALAATT